MAQPIQTTRVSYTVTTATTGPFTVPFRFFSADDLRVAADGVAVSGFTTTGNDNPAGGALTLATAVSNCTLVIYRDTVPERATDFPSSGPLRTTKLNSDLDRQVAVAQDLAAKVARTLRLSDGDLTDMPALPPACARANRVMAFDALGRPQMMSAIAGTLIPEAANVTVAPPPNGVATTVDELLGERKSLTRFGAVGDRVTDDTAAVQRALDSGERRLYVPPGRTYRMTGRLVISQPLRLEGNGTLLWTDGVANGPAIEVRADGVVFDGVELVNGTRAAANTGAAQFGIYFRANEGRVANCTTRHWQSGVGVSAYGEYTRFIFLGNDILDCISSGDGPSDPVSTRGEDRGDGIVVWGAIAVISGNVITAARGGDSRIGIHVEGLDSLAADPGPYPGALVSVTGNTIEGPWRRGVVLENIRQGAVTGNTVAGSTWWGIALAATWGCSVIGNTIRYDRAAENLAGRAWNPKYAALMLINGCSGSVVANNPITVTGAADAGIYVQSFPALRGSGNRICGNNIQIDSTAALTAGVHVQYEDRISVGQNDISGATAHGIYAFNSNDVKISDNKVTGKSGVSTNPRHGIHVEGGTQNIVSCINEVDAFDVGLYIVNAVGGKISSNYVHDCQIAGDFFGTSKFSIDNNTAVDTPGGWLRVDPNATNNLSL